MQIRVLRNLIKKKKKVEGKIVESINEPDFIDFKNFITCRNIELPTHIDEFYVDNDNEDPENFSNNEDEFDKIFKKIKNTRPMFQSVTKIEYDQIETAGHMFPVKQTWRKIKYLDYDNNEICTNPYISFESEETNYPIIRYRKRKEVIDSESDCGDVRIKYDYYETRIYNVDGREVEGKECYKGSGWE